MKLRSLTGINFLIFSFFFVLTGCLSFDETVVLHANGSGVIRIVYGLGKDGKVDKEKADSIRQSIDSLAGLRWKSTVDSTAKNGRWYGGVIEFDSIHALDPLDKILPLKGFFGSLTYREKDGVASLDRIVPLVEKHPEIPSPMIFTITWSFPGEIQNVDALASWVPGSKTVHWKLPVDGAHGNFANLHVSWINRTTPFIDPEIWPIIAGAEFVLLVFFAVVAMVGVVVWARRKNGPPPANQG